MSAQPVVGFVATVAAMAAYGGLHSLLASRPVKKWARQTFGAAADRSYRLLFNALGGVTFLPVLAVPLLLPGELLYSAGPPWLWLLFGLQLAAIVLLSIAIMQTGALQFLGIAQLLQLELSDGEFVTDGLYRWVRHPLYSAGLLFIWSLPRMTTSLLALNLGVTAYLYLGSLHEERRLLAEFGEQYAGYQRRVPRLIPHPWRHSREPDPAQRA